jgi:soluble P-type ATPase
MGWGLKGFLWRFVFGDLNKDYKTVIMIGEGGEEKAIMRNNTEI